MSKKNTFTNNNGFVYSTNPDFKIEEEEAVVVTKPVDKQPLRVLLDTKQRAGKAVTLITGFVGTNEDCEKLGKQLKAFCGTGGSVKDFEIIVQGDNRQKIFDWLQKNNYKLSKKIGG
jgi:translation initiation factor 1